jgi:hypothetical protein
MHRTWTGGDATNPNKWDVPANWFPSDNFPQNNDEVTIGAGGEAILDGLDQWAKEFDLFHGEEGFTATIGLPGSPLRFKMNVDDVLYAGSGTAFIEVEADQVTINDISPVIAACGRGQTGVPGLELRGTTFKKLSFTGAGSLGVGTSPGDTASRMDEAIVTSAGTLQVGPDIQKIAAGAPDVVVAHANATVIVDCDVGEVDAQRGVYRQRNGKWTTATVYKATAYAAGTGTHGNTYVDAGGKVHVDANDNARTFTDVEIQNGGVWQDPAGTGSYTNPIEFPTGMDGCSLDFGRKKKLEVRDIP